MRRKVWHADALGDGPISAIACQVQPGGPIIVDGMSSSRTVSVGADACARTGRHKYPEPTEK